MTDKKKRPVLNFLKKIFSLPLVRGVIKAFPFGNLAYEIAENVKHAKATRPENARAPHNAVSLLAQMVFLALIIWAFYTKQITIDTVIDLFSSDPVRWFFEVGNSINPADTLSNG
jgi:hypothetical protein